MLKDASEWMFPLHILNAMWGNPLVWCLYQQRPRQCWVHSPQFWNVSRGGFSEDCLRKESSAWLLGSVRSIVCWIQLWKFERKPCCLWWAHFRCYQSQLVGSNWRIHSRVIFRQSRRICGACRKKTLDFAAPGCLKNKPLLFLDQPGNPNSCFTINEYSLPRPIVIVLVWNAGDVGCCHHGFTRGCRILFSDVMLNSSSWSDQISHFADCQLWCVLKTAQKFNILTETSESRIGYEGGPRSAARLHRSSCTVKSRV